MDMVLQGLSYMADPAFIAYSFIGIIVGLTFGFIPGLSGMTVLVCLLPFIAGMPPALGLGILLSAHAVVYTGGSITAVILNIPGAPANAATLIDGYPMALKGEAGRGIGNALTASALGGVVGSIILAACIAVLAGIVMLFHSQEIFLLSLLGVLCIAVLGQGSMVKGLISGGLGMGIAFVGYHIATGVPRLTFGQVYLYDGFPLIPVALGFFALPEMLEMSAAGSAIAKVEKEAKAIGSDIMRGVKDVFVHWWLFLRCSFIGTIVGIIPGAGGETAPFVAYGYAKQTSKRSKEYGTGCEEGVIAPESANNAKEGGSLVPTLALGIPGSSAMSIYLGAFWLVGLEPGPNFLKEHLDIAYTLVFTLAAANVVGAAIMFLFAKPLTRITYIRGHLVVPMILAFCLVGSYIVRNNWWDALLLIPFGALGYFLKKYGFNRPGCILGFVLAPLAEKYFLISMRVGGFPSFFTRPISLGLVVIIIFLLSYNQVKKLWSKPAKA